MTAFTLHLLRHGEPEMPGRLMGRTDGVPTLTGIAACAARANSLDIESLVVSDMARARLAGEAIAVAHNLSILIDSRWRELDFGAWDGFTVADIDKTRLAAFWDDPDINPPPDGERWSALVDRVAHAIADLAPISTLVVTHGGAMRAALAVLCGFSQRQLWAFDLPYASLLSLRIWRGERATAQIIGLAS